MNVYKFSLNKNEYQIVVAPSLAAADDKCTIPYSYVKVLYEDVIVVSDLLSEP